MKSPVDSSTITSSRRPSSSPPTVMTGFPPNCLAIMYVTIVHPTCKTIQFIKNPALKTIPMISEALRRLLAKQHYSLVGGHSAVKPCLWLKKSLRGEGHCYKQRFYGIESHRCMQMTPAVGWCTHACVFCWRNTEHTMGVGMDSWEDPEEIVEGCFNAQRQAISGFGGSDGVDMDRFREAQEPSHAAISLAGEPTIYPDIGGLIECFKKRAMTTYLVTNGTLPGRLEALDTLPSQLYMSLVAPDRETHRRVCAPLVSDAWDSINSTLELFPSLDTRKVIRLTAVKGWNMLDPQAYARLISRANPDFVEVKAFMFVGGSRNRLSMDNMPSHSEVRAFAGELAGELSYEVADEKVESRVALLKR
ncbi:MAG: 4-demethylwyosine synthase TYW1 [Candidatus Altiarchaeales archaeon]|nr:4-demethylwyosine synthase TYW1 [Candidatus Altiarchaeales archaeon]MBD3416570.1 4-demethylwyosine synthase TYW1 [Candidatus Altiarchaeales archaeon]